MTRRAHHRGFTIIEVMIAIAIFSMILISIYSVWAGILRATDAARNAAVAAQRARIGIRTIEDALLTAQMFTANMPPQNRQPYYSFVADNTGDFAYLSFVAHLPATFPGVGRYGENIVRRVSFSVEKGEGGTQDLILRQGPMLMTMNEDFEPYSLVLAKDIQVFIIEYWGQQKETRQYEWVNEWNSTNALPKLIRIALGVGKTSNKNEAQELVYRVIALPATAVAPEWQLPMGRRAGVPPGGVPPGNPPLQGNRPQ